MHETSGPQIRGIDAGPVSAWLESHIDGAVAPFTFEPIEGGHSNLTYRVTDGTGSAYVLRRPPLGARSSILAGQ